MLNVVKYLNRNKLEDYSIHVKEAIYLFTRLVQHRATFTSCASFQTNLIVYREHSRNLVF